jgi:hypothetical protein
MLNAMACDPISGSWLLEVALKVSEHGQQGCRRLRNNDFHDRKTARSVVDSVQARAISLKIEDSD